MRMTKFWTSNSKVLLGGGLLVLILLLGFYLLLPRIILTKVNSTLDQISPLFTAHIDDLDLSLLRMSYRFGNMKARVRSSPAPFFEAESLDVSLAWRELIRFHIVTDIIIHRLHLNLDTAMIALTTEKSEESKRASKEASGTLFPVAVTRILIANSAIEFAQLQSLRADHRIRLANLEAQATHLTPQSANEESEFYLKGEFGKSALTIKGQAYIKRKPVAWSVDSRLENFDLPHVRGVLYDLSAISMNAGMISAYSEVKSENAKLLGYVKVFLKDLDFVGDRNDFKRGGRQFLLEIFGALGNLILRDSKTKTVAAQIDFKSDESGFQVNKPKLIESVLENAFSENKLEKGVEGSVELGRKSPHDFPKKGTEENESAKALESKDPQK